MDVAYILLRFPHQTETFVAEEIRQVQNLGVKVHIFSLLSPMRDLIHPVSAELLPQVRYVPGIHSPSIWWAQLHYLIKTPGQYIKLLWVLLTQPAPEIFSFPKRLITFIKSVWLARELKQSPLQLVHTHFAWLSAAACITVSQLLDVPFTVTAHAFDIYSLRNDLLVLTTKLADRVVTISEYNKRAILEKSDTLEVQQIEVIHCGIDLDNFQVNDRDPANQAFQITSVGSLIEKKGHEYLIRACGELETRGINFHCVIIGDGLLRQTLNELIQDLNMEDKVVLVGTQSQTWVREILKKSDLFVLACVVAKGGGRDGIPVSMMEALAMEVPVVSTTVSGIPELIKHEITGLLVSERDSNALADAISRLALDKPFRQNLARRGRTLIEREYNTTTNTSRLVELFQRVIEERGK
jgi:glycosyltransferase involved in cell wall biosynthesis